MGRRHRRVRRRSTWAAEVLCERLAQAELRRIERTNGPHLVGRHGHRTIQYVVATAVVGAGHQVPTSARLVQHKRPLGAGVVSIAHSPQVITGVITTLFRREAKPDAGFGTSAHSMNGLVTQRATSARPAAVSPTAHISSEETACTPRSTPTPRALGKVPINAVPFDYVRLALPYTDSPRMVTCRSRDAV